MTTVQRFVYGMTFKRLSGKRLWWSKRVRVYCDAGSPSFRRIPRYRRLAYSRHWGLYGFAVYWLGREFTFSFGQDHNGLYSVGINKSSSTSSESVDSDAIHNAE